MKLEDLKELVRGVVKEQIAPLEETQRKYAGLFDDRNNPAPVPAQKGETLQPGIRVARLAKLMVVGKNDPERALHFATGGENNSAKGMYPNDVELHNTLKALSASTPSEGGYLIQEAYANEIIPLLYAKAVVRKLGARALPMANGNLNIPRMTNGATSYYQGENRAAKASKQNFGNLKLSGRKLITLVPLSNDLIRSSSANADAMVRDDMIRAMALKEDWAALYGTGTEFTPRGIASTKGITTAAYNEVPTTDNDFSEMIGTLLAANVDLASGSPGWVFNGMLWSHFYNLTDGKGAYIHRAEMDKGKFFGLPFAISNQVQIDKTANKATDIFLGDWSEFIIGEQEGMELMASNEATYTDENGDLVSAFSNDQTVIKVTSIHDFGVRHPEAFNMKTKVFTQA